MSNLLKVNTLQASKLIEKTLNAGLCPIITSSPGLGKSDIIRALAKKMGLYLIDIRLAQCEPSDLSGIPNFIQHNGKTRVEFIPSVMFPLEGDALPLKEDGAPYNGWLLFFDELLDAPMQVQSASYKVILDRMIGNFPLHEKVMMVGAGNKIDDGACATETSTALKSRMVWMELEMNAKAWITWAKDAEVNPSIIGFIEYEEKHLYNFSADHEGFTFACPRTWSMASRIMKQYTQEEYASYDFQVHMQGTVGNAHHDFGSFLSCFDKLPTKEQIVRDPMGCHKVVDGERFALKTLIARWADDKSIENILKYISRLDKDTQVLLFREIRDNNKPLMSNKYVTEWSLGIGKEIFGKVIPKEEQKTA